MIRNKSFFLFFTLFYLGTFSLFSLSLNLPMATNADIDKVMESGKTIKRLYEVQGSNIKTGQIIGIVNANPKRIWKAITDYANFNKIMPYMTDASHLIGWIDEYTALMHGELEVPAPIYFIAYDIELFHYPEEFFIEWDMVPGTGENIRKMSGYWELIPDPHNIRRCVLVYTVSADPITDLSPGIINYAIKVSLGKVLTAVKEESE
ncbi:MAG: hypothetical protein ABIA04_01060 [Pseudomonadota bacterium]